MRFTCPEFTAFNPATGEPYQATILINYIPDKFLVESKSLKLYLFSFRNFSVGDDLASLVLKDLQKLLSPKYMEVEVRTSPRMGLEGNVMKTMACTKSKFRKLARDRSELFDQKSQALATKRQGLSDEI